MTCRTCLTSAHKLHAVVVLQTLHKVDLQGGHTHVCSHHTGSRLTWPPDHPIKLLKWLDVNASSMWLGEFTPEFIAVHSWSDYQRRVFHAKCKVCSADDVIMLASLSPLSCQHSHTWEGTSRGKGIRLGAPLGEGLRVMSVRHLTASKNDSRWSDAQPNSHYHESTGC